METAPDQNCSDGFMSRQSEISVWGLAHIASSLSTHSTFLLMRNCRRSIRESRAAPPPDHPSRDRKQALVDRISRALSRVYRGDRPVPYNAQQRSPEHSSLIINKFTELSGERPLHFTNTRIRSVNWKDHGIEVMLWEILNRTTMSRQKALWHKKDWHPPPFRTVPPNARPDDNNRPLNSLNVGRLLIGLMILSPTLRCSFLWFGHQI
jgi:hypothetical protein